MATDDISVVQIDNSGRLRIQPVKEKFTMIYRSAAEVHWDNDGDFLFSPKPREWSYLDWYKHIISIVATEYGCWLRITEDTQWITIPEELKSGILIFDKNNVA